MNLHNKSLIKEKFPYFTIQSDKALSHEENKFLLHNVHESVTNSVIARN